MLGNVLRFLVVATLLSPLVGASAGPVSLVNLHRVASDVVVGVLGVPSTGVIEVTVQRVVKGAMSPGMVVSIPVRLPLAETARDGGCSAASDRVFSENSQRVEIRAFLLNAFLTRTGCVLRCDSDRSGKRLTDDAIYRQA